MGSGRRRGGTAPPGAACSHPAPTGSRAHTSARSQRTRAPVAGRAGAGAACERRDEDRRRAASAGPKQRLVLADRLLATGPFQRCGPIWLHARPDHRRQRASPSASPGAPRTEPRSATPPRLVGLDVNTTGGMPSGGNDRSATRSRHACFWSGTPLRLPAPAEDLPAADTYDGVEPARVARCMPGHSRIFTVTAQGTKQARSPAGEIRRQPVRYEVQQPLGGLPTAVIRASGGRRLPNQTPASIQMSTITFRPLAVRRPEGLGARLHASVAVNLAAVRRKRLPR